MPLRWPGVWALHVNVFDLNVNTLRKIDAEYGGAIETRYSSRLDLENAVKQADLVIGAVWCPGRRPRNWSPTTPSRR